MLLPFVTSKITVFCQWISKEQKLEKTWGDYSLNINPGIHLITRINFGGNIVSFEMFSISLCLWGHKLAIVLCFLHQCWLNRVPSNTLKLQNACLLPRMLVSVMVLVVIPLHSLNADDTVDVYTDVIQIKATRLFPYSQEIATQNRVECKDSDSILNISMFLSNM